MEYQKITNLLDKSVTQTSKFQKNCFELIDDAHGTCNTNSQIKFKGIMLKLSLCDYSDAYILIKGVIRITRAGADATARQVDGKNGQVIFKSCVPFTACISKRNNIQFGNAKDLDVVMSMYNLMKFIKFIAILLE